jgi:hypothetical protein
MFVARAVAALAAVTAGTIPAQAAFLNNATGLSNPSRLITFGEFVFTQNTSITSQYSGLGVTFSPNLYYNPSGAFAGIPNISQDGRRLGNFGGPVVDPFTINFTSQVTAASFAMGTVAANTTFIALLDGVEVERATRPTNLTNTTNYYGFTGITFNAIRVDVNGGNNTMQLDNLSYSVSPASVVPAPPAVVLAVAGAWCLALLRLARRRK